MKKILISYHSIMIILVFIAGIVIFSCQKKEQTYIPENLTVTIAGHELRHGLYYSLSPWDRSMELDFSEPLDTASVAGNIRFSDKSGSPDPDIYLHPSGRKVLLMLDTGFQLRAGWQYFLEIGAGIRSVSGINLAGDKLIELRSTFVHPDPGAPAGGDTTTGNSLAVISDIHMGLAQSNDLKYGWFGKNKAALEDFLDYLLTGKQVRQLVIIGDLFDEWIVPYTLAPFDSQAGISNSRDYFLAVAANPVNSTIFGKLRAIAASGTKELIYVPGNHDMLMTQQIVEEIIPGVIWAGDAAGLGKYLPVPEIIMEHGHRYDFFNCPQPLVNSGHMLPPGYFISRLYAQGTMEHPGKSLKEVQGSFEFLAAWDVAYYYTILHFQQTLPDPTVSNILMTGIDGYQTPMSFNGARDMYAASIEDYWPATQAQNGVVVPMPCCLQVIWNGHSDLFSAAKTEYLEKPPAPVAYKIAAFGHTHAPMLQVYPSGNGYTGIYANTGSWVDANQSSHAVRTYLIITPGAWSGSAIDVVSLYQYNIDSNSGNPDPDYQPVLLAEESIGSGN
jgi:UDP-2,3-diacylglucosamine pyrophosphatase LpxH